MVLEECSGDRATAVGPLSDSTAARREEGGRSVSDHSLGLRSRALALGVSGLFIVSACSGSTSPAPSQGAAGAPSGGPAGAGSGQIGGSLTLWTAWGGNELKTFQNVLAPFKAKTGIDVKITTVRDANQLAINVEAGTTLPDIAGPPTFDKVPDWASKGVMKPLESYLDMASYTADTLPGLLAGGTEVGIVDGKHYELFVKTQVKNLLWYNAKVTKDPSPKTWDEVLKMTPPSGGKLFCVGLESGADSGWPATDNIEGIIMRQSGDQVYNDWWQGKHKWSSPEIKKAFETFGQMVSADNVYGGPNTVLTTNFGRAGKPMFATPPGCVFEEQATFITNFFLEDYPNLKPVDDFNFVPPPSYNSQYDGNIEFFFDAAVMYNDTPQSRAFMNYLATADAQAIFVKGGGTLAANKKVTEFPDPVFKHASEVVSGASKLLVDGSDNMPNEMRTAFLKATLDFAKDQSKLDSILANLDTVQSSAYAK
jgi:alpha-glucoside transport system substrate-binding protein